MPPTSAASREASAQWQPPQRQALQSSRQSSRASSGGTYDLSANWGTIFVILCALPWVALFTLNPISLFFIVFWGVLLIFATFLPKLVHFALLELAIIKGRWTDFYQKNHDRKGARDTRPPFSISLAYLEAISAYLSMKIGPPDAVAKVALKEVAVCRDFAAKKVYTEGKAMEWDEVARRLAKFPWQLLLRFHDHAKSFIQISMHEILKFVALNIVARTYTKTYVES